MRRRKKRNVPDLLVSHATSAGNRKRAARIEVSRLYYFLSQSILMDGVALIGHHHIPNTIMKKEPKSPSQPTTRKHKTFSATTGEPIGYVKVIDEDPPLLHKHAERGLEQWRVVNLKSRLRRLWSQRLQGSPPGRWGDQWRVTWVSYTGDLGRSLLWLPRPLRILWTIWTNSFMFLSTKLLISYNVQSFS